MTVAAVNGTRPWKFAATFLAGLLISGVPIIWAVSTKASISDVEHIVQTRSPYVQDKGEIFQRLQVLQDAVDELGAGGDATLTQLNSLSVLVAQLQTQVEQLETPVGIGP